MPAFLPSQEIEKLQLQKLLETVAYVQQYSPFYKALYATGNVSASHIKCLADIEKLPVTTKEDMQKHNWDFLCVNRSKIIEYTSTSGTLGKPVTVALTEKDLDRLAYNEWLSIKSMECHKDDIFQLILTLDRQFMAGMAYYSGIRKMGAGMVRVGPGAPAQQWDIIHRLQPTVLVGVPSFITKLIDYALHKHINLNNSSVKKALCIGENLRNAAFELNALGKKISSQWDIQLFSTYASTEMQTAFTECTAGQGGHLNPDLLLVEILDEHNQPVPAGEEGEVTVTTLGVEGMPVVRYKTGDICRLETSPCSCGRNSLRISPVIGRKSQMIKLKGTSIYPPAIFDLLNELPEVKDYVAEVSENELGLDELTLYIAPSELSAPADQAIKGRLQGSLRVIPDIKYLPEETIQQMQFAAGSRKPIKFMDKRGA